MSRWRVESGYLGRYLGVGSVNTIVGFVAIFLLMWLGVSPIIANVAGYAVGFCLGFVLSKKLVFRSDGHFVAEGFRYLLAFFVSFLVNLLVLRLCLYVLDLPKVWGQLMAGASYTLLMYFLTRLFVFVLPEPRTNTPS